MHRTLPAVLIFVVLILSVLTIRSSATPFTIDGSTVYVNAGFVGIRTSTPITVLDVNGDAQFGSGASKSTFTATGLLKLTSSGIQWADGSVSTTAASGSGFGIRNSTTIINIPTASDTNTNWVGCIPGSTASFNVTQIGSNVLASAYGDFRMSNTNLFEVRILMDGRPSASNDGVVDAYYTLSTAYSNSTYDAKAYFTNVSSGTRSFCYGFKCNSSCSYDAYSPTVFHIEEIGK